MLATHQRSLFRHSRQHYFSISLSVYRTQHTVPLNIALSSKPEESANSVLTLYQYATCPFCNRVKSYLDYLNHPYKVVEVNPITKKEIKVLNKKQVPILTVDDSNTVLSESSVIIQYIHDNFHSGLSSDLVTTQGTKKFITTETQKWSDWSEKQLAVVLYPNITKTFGESWAAFSYVNQVETWTLSERLTNRLLGPVAMFAVRGKIKTKYGIVDERAELAVLLTDWTKALEASVSTKPAGTRIAFLNGAEIALEDLMVFGVLRGLEGLETHDFVMAHNPVLRSWYALVTDEIAERKKLFVQQSVNS